MYTNVHLDFFHSAVLFVGKVNKSSFSRCSNLFMYDLRCHITRINQSCMDTRHLLSEKCLHSKDFNQHRYDFVQQTLASVCHCTNQDG